jgi:hypothetical protein
MAISAAIGVGKKIVGKAISAAKKKKKDLETKGKKVKKSAKENILKDAQKIKDPSGKNIRGNIKGVDAIPNVMAGAAGQTATKVSGKAVNIAKNVSDKTVKTAKKIKDDPIGSAKKAATNLVGDDKDEVIGFGVGALAAMGTAALTASLTKSNTKPEQEYNVTRMSDGRFSTTYRDKNANAVFSAKQLSEKEIDDVRTQLAVLDSILDSSDPKARSKEFKDTVMNLAKKYKISNITGKNLSVIIPNVEGGVQLRQRA